MGEARAAWKAKTPEKLAARYLAGLHYLTAGDTKGDSDMKMVRTIVNILSLAFTAAPTVFGYRTYVVLSGSMEPAIHTGAVVVAQPVPPTSLKVGDVIVYNRSDADERITHRIVDIKDADAGRPTFTTKGDANGAPDPWTVQYPTNTAGKVVFSVPYVGYLDAALESPQGRLAFIIIP